MAGLDSERSGLKARAPYRGREDRLSSRPPLPPNRTCGSPASGSPVGGFTSERIDGLGIGCVVGEQPKLSKEGIRPVMMVYSSATSVSPRCQAFPEVPEVAHFELSRRL